MTADPIEARVAELSAVLHGPARLKARMLEELRGGLADAAADLSPGPDPDAARRAVAEFGSVSELAPAFQRELTLAQARRTARTMALLLPLLIAGRYWAGSSGTAPHLLHLAAVNATALAAATALLATVFLALTGAFGRRLPTPGELPLAVAWTGTVAAAAVGVGALTLTAAAVLSANWPLAAATALLALGSHARIASSARACRRCARLPRADAFTM
ncbi:permease prefix domain 1-containing protein [Actinocorallia populi]|uniref:permease prefix domain 1-containing protein n=1 Tax=Actinocorallia populi TaxID=2079200 RepID=UPI000D0877E9|nr:permease prefix domain 1-containing protein [Actinocorallia populi]